MFGLFRSPDDPICVMAGICAAIDDGKHQLGCRGCIPASLHTKLFYSILGFPNPRCVNQAEIDPFELNTFLDSISCRPWYISYNGSIIPKQGVQQRAFPCIGETDDCSRDSAVHKLSSVKCTKQPLQRTFLLTKLRTILLYFKFFDVFIRIIQNCVKMCTHIHEFGIYRICLSVNGT